jgi:hypothetical protein
MNGPNISTVVCHCCELDVSQRNASEILDTHGLVQGYRCAMCNDHWGNPLKMAKDHEEELRVRWGETLDKLDAALNAAEEYRERMKAAFRSREAVLRHFERLAKELASYHRATDHGCSCGDRDCEIPSLIEDDWINDLIRNMHEHR